MQISTTAQTFLSQKTGQLATIRNIMIFGKWEIQDIMEKDINHNNGDKTFGWPYDGIFDAAK